MSSFSTIAVSSGLVAFLVPLLMSRYPAADMSPFDRPDLARRNRWIKWGFYAWLTLPIVTAALTYRYFAVPNESLTPAVSLLSISFLAPVLWVLACTLPAGRFRLAEFIRYSELNDRVSGWVHRFVLGAMAAAGVVGLAWDLPRAIEWWQVVDATRAGVA